MESETLALWFSNYSSLATKNLRSKLAEKFDSIARVLESRARMRRKEPATIAESAKILGTIESQIEDCIATGYPGVKDASDGDRGVLRAYTWGNKVATILKTVVGRVISKGDAVIVEGQSFFVCDGCGFIYIGAEAPAICPVCKAPASRFASY